MWLSKVDFQAGGGQAAVDQLGPVLDLLQLAFDDADQVGLISGEAEAFLQANAAWVVERLDRVERLRSVRRVQRRQGGTILLRGEPTRVCREEVPGRRGGNWVERRDGAITSPLSAAIG